LYWLGVAKERHTVLEACVVKWKGGANGIEGGGKGDMCEI
jgi:hypothetical protein